MSFHSLMTEFFEASDISDLIEHVLAYCKAQTENAKFLESGFTLHKIMNVFINFHRLVLTWGSSYNESPKWIKSKKAVINSQNKDEEYCKWAVIAALHHEKITKNNSSGRINLLRFYEK